MDNVQIVTVGMLLVAVYHIFKTVRTKIETGKVDFHEKILLIMSVIFIIIVMIIYML